MHWIIETVLWMVGYLVVSFLYGVAMGKAIKFGMGEEPSPMPPPSMPPKDC